MWSRINRFPSSSQIKLHFNDYAWTRSNTYIPFNTTHFNRNARICFSNLSKFVSFGIFMFVSIIYCAKNCWNRWRLHVIIVTLFLVLCRRIKYLYWRHVKWICKKFPMKIYVLNIHEAMFVQFSPPEIFDRYYDVCALFPLSAPIISLRRSLFSFAMLSIQRFGKKYCPKVQKSATADTLSICKSSQIP